MSRVQPLKEQLGYRPCRIVSVAKGSLRTSLTAGRRSSLADVRRGPLRFGGVSTPLSRCMSERTKDRIQVLALYLICTCTSAIGRI